MVKYTIPINSGSMPDRQHTLKTFDFRFINQREVHDEIKSIKCNKSSLPSTLPAWALKDASGVIVPSLTSIPKICIGHG